MLRFTYTLLKLVYNNMSRSREPLDRVWIFRTSDEPEMHKRLSHCLLNYIRSQHNDLYRFRHNKHCFSNPATFSSQPVHIASCVGGIISQAQIFLLSCPSSFMRKLQHPGYDNSMRYVNWDMFLKLRKRTLFCEFCSFLFYTGS